jgi:PIN domain nuclease of toxin-antitoxin system
MVNLDTHILVFALQGRLRPAEKELLSSRNWGISSIVLWELSKLVQLGRLEMDLASARTRRALGRVSVWPIDLEIARISTRLDFKGDPADELIAATSVVHEIPLVTRDREMRRSKLVPLAC